MCLVPSKGKHVTSGASAGKHETNMLSLCYRMGPRLHEYFQSFHKIYNNFENTSKNKSLIT